MKYGISTFSSASVYGALNIASRFAKLFGKEKSSEKYFKVAEKIKDAIMKNLYDEKMGYFYKLITKEKGDVVIDKIADISSVYGIYVFGILNYDDPKLKKAFDYVSEKLETKTPVWGYAR